jgi:RimJ/RimL family protein N-acetyltransferase
VTTQPALHEHWPLFNLAVRTPRLEVRLPRDDDLAALATLAAAGIHDPATMPFAIPWTDVAPPELQRQTMQWGWRQRAEWRPDSWTFAGAVVVDGAVVGVQEIAAQDFAARRTVMSGSWLGREHQGHGIGVEMRAAILHLAFAGLGAVEAYSGAWYDNAASLAVSRRLGYRDNGTELRLRRRSADRHIALRITREEWEVGRRDDIEIVGLHACMEMFGAG